MQKCWILFAACAVTALASATRGQTYKDDVGYTRLKTEQGSSMPTGSGVVVAHVEAPQYGTTDYYPMTAGNSEFTDKTITPESMPTTYTTSEHATDVGKYFYGNNSSLSPGITSIHSYNANGWLSTDFLNFQSASLPNPATERVANHSWIGYDTVSDSDPTPYPAGTLEMLQRVDYVVQTDNLINVVAENNPNNNNAPGAMPLLADSFNSISVGLTNGEENLYNNVPNSGTTGDTDDSQDVYIAGRAAPDVVAPMAETSYATPLVASASALLVQVAHGNPLLSAGTVTTSNGTILEYGETADVIKAAIMAGADRVTMNTSTSDQITDYGADKYQTTGGNNGLDTRYGAGQLDIYNSYHIIAAGQQGPGVIGTYGFDYKNASADTAVENYTFTGTTGIAATLAWNVHITATAPAPDSDDNYTFSAMLAHFQLKLFDLTADGGTTPVDASTSMIDNTQNIFDMTLTATDIYELQVTRNDADGDWEYGLAWDLDPVPEPGSAMIFVVGIGVALGRRSRRKSLISGICTTPRCRTTSSTHAVLRTRRSLSFC